MTMDKAALLSGNLDIGELQDPPSKAIRIYLSSAGTDTVRERDVLAERVYPKLRKYCRQNHGLEFQVVDLHWGQQESWNEHSEDRKLCMKELERCQKLSAGPSIVALLTQKYGGCLLPVSIPEDHFDLILGALRQHKSRDTRDFYHLEHWYSKEENCSPPAYVLQNEESVTNNVRPQTAIDKAIYGERNVVSWVEAKDVLQRLLTIGIGFCLQDGLLVLSDVSSYMCSDLETELRAGVLLNPDPEKTCGAILREIVDLKNYVSHPLASNFIDVGHNEGRATANHESETKMKHLVEDTFEKWLPKDNTDSFSVLWKRNDGINVDHHKDYLQDVCVSFGQMVKSLVDKTAPSLKASSRSGLENEVCQHWLVAKEYQRGFIGRDAILDTIKSYVTSNDSKPLVLYGESGCGKTAIIAQTALEIPAWFDEPVFVMVRFIGQTLDSIDIRLMLHSICSQLSELLHMTEMVPSSFEQLESYFLGLLSDFPDDQNLVIFLDSVDRLSFDNQQGFMSWLPSSLKSNVKIVLTTHNERQGVLEHISSAIITDENNYLEITQLSPSECLDLLTSTLSGENRTLTPGQLAHVSNCAFEKCGQPLYVKLVLDTVVPWTSNYDVSNSDLPKNCRDFIKAMLSQLEVKHGTCFTRKALGYLVASENGLTECEIEDLLSLDEEVLNEILPSYSMTIRRVPPIAWLRLQNDLSEYLCRKEMHGVTLCFWKNTIFIDTCRDDYLKENNDRKQIHSTMADYFLGTWANQKKPFTRPSSANNNEVHGDADRLVPDQPLTFEALDKTIYYNRRKFFQVPRHLFLSERFTELKELVLFSYSWLYNKAVATSTEQMLADFSLNPGVQTTLVEKALRDAQESIKQNMTTMAAEISGRLLPYFNTHPYIQKLIQDCDKVGLSQCAMIPNFPYRQIPGSPLKITITCNRKFTDLALKGPDDSLLLAKDKDDHSIQIYDVKTGKTSPSIFASVGSMYLSPDGSRLVIVDHVTEKTAKIHHTDSGRFMGQLIPMNQIQIKPKDKYKLSDVSVSNDHICMTVTTDTSYLFVGDLHTCKFLHVLGLEGRSNICEITPDARYVFCSSNETLLAYDLATLRNVTNTALEQRPKKIIFNSDTTRAFVVNGIENKIFMLTLSDGSVDFLYKVVLQESFPGDVIVQLSLSYDESMLLVQGRNNIIVYDISEEKICCQFSRPVDVPVEFKLPGSQYEEISFKETCFSSDDKFVIATMFRNIYIWNLVSNRLLTSLQAPVGTIQELFVPKHHGHIISHSQNSDSIQIWGIGDAIGHVGMYDNLTAPINAIVLTQNDRRALVSCTGSDEIGIIEMTNGNLIDLLTHENPVKRFAATQRGEYVLVALEKAPSNVCNKIWYVPERKIIYEFGDSPAHCVAMATEDTIFSLCQERNSFKIPYKLTRYDLKDDTFTEHRVEHSLNFVLSKPFITPEDKYLVCLTAEGYDDATTQYIDPSICAVALKAMNVSTYSVDFLRQSLKINRILHIRPCPKNPYTVICLFTDEPDPTEPKSPGKEYVHCISFMIFDICSGVICQVLKDFVVPQCHIDRMLFTDDISLCLDQDSNVIDMGNGYFVKEIPNTSSSPKILALNGTVVIYNDQSNLKAVRLSDNECIADLNVHGTITSVALCHDQRTLVLGCNDGSVVSYVLLDDSRETIESVLSSIPSRNTSSDPNVPKHCRAWDKVDVTHGPPYSRPPSALIQGPRAKDILSKVKHVSRTRPVSDTSLYLSSRSKTCVLQ